MVFTHSVFNDKSYRRLSMGCSVIQIFKSCFLNAKQNKNKQSIKCVINKFGAFLVIERILPTNTSCFELQKYPFFSFYLFIIITLFDISDKMAACLRFTSLLSKIRFLYNVQLRCRFLLYQQITEAFFIPKIPDDRKPCLINSATGWL